MALVSECSRLDALISQGQYSAAVELALSLLHQGEDFEVVEDELCFAISSFISSLFAFNTSDENDKVKISNGNSSSKGNDRNEHGGVEHHGCPRETTVIDPQRVEKAEWLWRTGLQACQWRSQVMLHGYAKFKCSINDILNGIDTVQRAMNRISPLDISIPLVESIENMKCLIVDQWHYRMLNDAERNTAYDRALQLILQLRPGSVVLDIGGGTGLLSMFAARAGAKHVYCCEMSKTIAEIASRCIAKNGYGNKITLLKKHSSDICIGVDLPSKVDVIVTELVDSGLLGEHIISTLEYAREHLLVDGGIVIPYSAEIYGVCISSSSIASRQRLLSPRRHLDDTASSYWSNIQYTLLAEQESRLCIDEYYTCEKLSSLEHSCLTDRINFGTIYFDKNFKDFVHSSLSVPTIACGNVEAIAYWFELQLLDDDTCKRSGVERVSTMDSRPRNSWDQAVVFLSKSDRELQCIQLDSLIRIETCPTPDKIEFKVASQKPPVFQTPSPKYYDDDDKKMFSIGEMDFALLNDFSLTETFQCCFNDMISGLEAPSQSLKILEFSSSWRSFFLNWSFERRKSTKEGTPHRAVVLCPSRQHKGHLEELSRCIFAPDMITEHVKVLHAPSVEVLFSAQDGGDKYLDCVVCDLIEGNGLMRQNALSDLDIVLRYHLRSPPLSPQRVLPYSIGICLCVLESPSLYRHHRVDQESTLDVDVGTELDKYRSSVLRELNLQDALPFPSTTEAQRVEYPPDSSSRFLSEEVEVAEVPLVQSLQRAEEEDSDLVYSCTHSLSVSRSGSAHCVALWFRIYLLESSRGSGTRVVLTGPRPSCSTPGGPHWRQAGFMLDTPLDVQRGDLLNVRVSVDKSSGVWCQYISHTKKH